MLGIAANLCSVEVSPLLFWPDTSSHIISVMLFLLLLWWIQLSCIQCWH